MEEEALILKLQQFLENGLLTRIGPFFNMDKTSGYVSLVAMSVPLDRFDEITLLVNSYDEVAHNYQREHKLNMWFVLAAKEENSAHEILRDIEMKSSLKTYNFPKEREFALDLYLEVM